MTNAQSMALPGAAGVLDTPKKITVIRLRWLLVIICSYLLLSSPETWLGPASVRSFILLYISTNIALYFVKEKLFDSSYFYSSIVIFDTLSVTAALVISGTVETDFYLAYFLIVILCAIWQDFRSVAVIAVLATLLYGLLLYLTDDIHDPSAYLRIPFLFVISLFYGYFAQIARVEKTLKEQAKQEAQDMAMVRTLSQALPSALDYQQILKTVRDKIADVIQATKLYLFMLNVKGDLTQGTLFGGEDGYLTQEVDLRRYPIVQECLMKRSPVIQHNVSSQHLSAESSSSERELSSPLSAAFPITFRGDLHGVILLGFDQPGRILNSREIQFCQIVAFATAIALSNAKRYEALQDEAQRRQQIVAEQLAEANRLRSEFLANTTHELRTPITVLVGYGDLMLEGIFGPLTEDQKAAMARMIQNAKGLLGLLEDILEYSQLERGRAALFIRQHEVRAVADDLRREVSRLEAGKPYKVQYEIDDGLPPIKTDWQKLNRVLLNLLSNAVKFTEQGEVKLSVTRRSHGEIAFSVSDTGIGIPKDQLPLIFEKFRQLDGSTSRRYGGAGLGLTVSKNLVDLLGGRLEVESEVGKGSTFRVILPVTSSENGSERGLLPLSLKNVLQGSWFIEA